MKRQIVSAVVLFVVSTLLLTSCGGGTTPTTKATTKATATTNITTTAATTTAATTTATTTTAPAVVEPKGALRFAITSFGNETLDPPASGATSINQLLLVYDFLVGVTPNGEDISTETGLANKWETSADGLTWTFHLRKGVLFDKGSGEVTAEDVKFSLQRNIAEGSLLPNALAMRAVIASIDVVDNYTLKINLKARSMFLPFNLSAMTDGVGAVVPKKYFEQVGGKKFALEPVGSGPYRLVRWETGSYFQFQARADYWNGVPKYKDLYLYKITEEATRIAMLKTNELDIAPVTLPNIKGVEAAGFVVFTKEERNNIIGGICRQWEGVLANPKVRLALNLSINREALLSSLFLGKGRANDDGNYDSAALGIRTLPHIGYDPVRARQLLKEAGYAGQEITLIPGPQDPIPLVSQAVAGYFEAIGVKVKLLPLDVAAKISGFKDPERINSISMTGAAQRGVNGMAAARVMFYTDGRWDLVRDPALDALIDKADAAQNLDVFAKAQGDVYEKVYNDNRLLYIVTSGEFFAASPKLKIANWTFAVGYNVGLVNLVMGR